MQKTLRAILVAVLGLLVLAPAAFAAGPVTWSAPLRLSEPGHAAHPLVQADAYGGVHVVWAQGHGKADESPDTLYYSSLLDGAWTPPIDIVAVDAPYTVVPMTLQVHGDHLFLLWLGLNQLVISRSPIAQASDATSWETVAVINGVSASGGALAVLPDGRLEVVFAKSPQQLVYATSEDQGFTWSPEVVVAQLEEPTSAIGEIDLAVDPRGARYVGWTLHAQDADWAPAGALLSRSLDEGASWLTPQPISAQSGHGMPDVFVDSAGRLYFTWLGNLASGGRYQIISDDMGATFSRPVILASFDQARGYAGRPQLIEDSAHALHLVFGAVGNGWPDSIRYMKSASPGDWSAMIRVTADSPDSQAPVMSLGLGHILHLVWTDYREYAVYYSYFETGAPALAAADLPTPLPASVTPAVQPTLSLSTVSPTAKPGARAIPINGSAPTRRSLDPAILGTAPAVILVAAVVTARLFRHKRR